MNLIRKEYNQSFELTEDEKAYISIPSSMIYQHDNDKVFLLLIYILFYVGVNNLLMINIKQVLQLYHYSDTNEKVIGQFKEAFLLLKQKEIIDFSLDDLQHSRAKFFKIRLNRTKFNNFFSSESEYYAMLYYDELLKAVEYKQQHNAVNLSAVMITLCYLKLCIPKRVNIIPLSYESLTIEEYQKVLPEAFNCYIYDIAQNTNLSAYAVSKAVKILKELEFIEYKIVQRWKHAEKWKRQHLIFSLKYKREKGKLLAKGNQYSNREINNKYDMLVRKKIIKAITNNERK